MKNRRRTEIRLETHEVTIIRYRSAARLECAECGAPTPHLSLAEAAYAFSLAAAEIGRLAADGRIHAAARGGHEQLYCGDSLAAYQRTRNETKE